MLPCTDGARSELAGRQDGKIPAASLKSEKSELLITFAALASPATADLAKFGQD